MHRNSPLIRVGSSRAKLVLPLLAAACASAAALSGCGNRVAESRVIAAEHGAVVNTSAQLGTTDTGGTTGSDGSSGTGAASSTAGADVHTAQPSVAGGGDATTTGSSTGSLTGSDTQSQSAPVSSTAATQAQASSKPGASKTTTPGKGAASPTAKAVAGSAPCTSKGSTLILGQTGSFSGLIGASINAHQTGVAIWQKAVNAAGGIQCHPVQVYQENDASSPAQAASNADDLIQNKHAVALFDVADPIVLDAVRSEITKFKIPIVGGDLSDPGWNEDPLLFTQGTSPVEGYTGGIAVAAAQNKTNKLGVLYCVEAAICSLIHSSMNQMATQSGTTLVFNQSISLTQSSYTSECQNAKSAGVQIIFMGADGSALSRLASSCASLGYYPALSGPGIAISPALSQNAALKKDGVYLGTTNAPFNTSDQPGTALWTAAVKQYAAGQAVDQSAMQGWSSGKLLEAALNAVGPSLRSRPITTDDILNGLYLLKGETLGGISPPITFTKGQPSPKYGCYWALVLTPSGFSAPDGGTRQGTC